MATILIGGSARLLAGRRASPDDVFWDAVRQTRKLALEGNCDVLLGYDDKNHDFTITDGAAVKTVPLPAVPPGFGVAFVPADNTGPQELLAGVLVASQSLPFVRFFGDGTCVPFRVQFHTDKSSHYLSIDPWTCAPVLTPLNPDGTPAQTPS